MTARRPDWETLNAYVDGELDARAQAEVAAAAADDSEVAAAVARLTQLKHAVREGASEAAGARPRIDASAGGAARLRWVRAAAASLLVAGTLGGLATTFDGPAEAPAWQGDALAVHARWADAPAGGAASTASAMLLAATADFDSPPFVPDLSAGKLALASVRRTRIAGAPALHLGYTGTRGCRVSLFVLAHAGDLPADLDSRSDDAGLTYAWRAGDLGYLLRAEGMGETRLAQLARSAHAATLRHRQPDAETRTAMRRQRAASPPCGA